MGDKNHNRLPINLPQLQNLIKRDKDAYAEEFNQQYRHYQALLQIFHLKPTAESKELDDIVMFLAQISHCYPDVLSSFPNELTQILQQNSTTMNPQLRFTMCRALMLLRSKGLIEPGVILELFFKLFRCQDKELRKALYSHIINDIKSMNAKRKNNSVNTQLQNFMYSMLSDSNATAVKLSLDIMKELYGRDVWKDTKTVNAISTACFSPITKVLVSALTFFLGKEKDDKKDSDDSDDDDGTKKNEQQMLLAHRVGKHTKKRKKRLDRARAKLREKEKKKKKPDMFDTAALHLLHDPQGFAERLMTQVEKTTERFEVKLMMIDLVSRLIGVHSLFLFNFYPYLQRFMQPHQREVPKILLFGAQASHDLVPPEILQPMVRTIVNNFVTERNANEVVAVGINAVREICNRSPLTMTDDLLGDLAAYKNSKAKPISMAARSIIGAFREINPEMLKRKDRGRMTEARKERLAMGDTRKAYGQLSAAEGVLGAEVLLGEAGAEEDNEEGEEEERGDEEEGPIAEKNVKGSGEDEGTQDQAEDDGDGAESDVEFSDFPDMESDDDSDDNGEGENDDDDEEDDDDDDDDDDGNDDAESIPRSATESVASSRVSTASRSKRAERSDKERRRQRRHRKAEILKEKAEEIKAQGAKNAKLDVNAIKERMEKARDISASGYVFTQEDFKRIKARQNEKSVKLDSKNRKRKLERDSDDDDDEDDSDDDSDEEDSDHDGPLLKIGAIEGVHAKRKNNKQAKIEAIKKGREGREKFGGRKEKMNPFASENTKQKKKHQPFMMVKQKMRHKKKTSFREKQAKLKKSMMRREKNSH